jgi:hypothetical protein
MIRRLLLALLLLVPAAVTAQDTGWEITSFDAAYTVNRDGTIDVVERIAVNFNDLQRRGIFREIPIRYRRVDGRGRETVDLSLRGVSNDRGEPLDTEVTRGDNARIRIGNPNVTVTGRQVYVIAYTIERGVGFFEHHDELYWQVTGTQWPVPILNATARVTIPEGGNPTDTTWTAWCYAGSANSNDNSRCTADVVPATEWRFSTGRLEPGEGLTLVAGFPKGIVPPPPVGAEAKRQAGIWWPLAMPFLAFIAMYRTWHARGREPHTGSVVPRWRIPEGMRPGIGGTLHDQSADLDDVIATLLDLAVRGYVTINEVKPPNPFEGLAGNGFVGRALRKLGDRKPGWAIERTEKATTDLVMSEREILDAILEGRSVREMRELHNKFHAKLPGLYRAFYDETVLAGWFVKSPQKVRNRWSFVGITTIVIGVVLGVAMQQFILAAAMAISGIIILAFARTMPQMTPRAPGCTVSCADWRSTSVAPRSSSSRCIRDRSAPPSFSRHCCPTRWRSTRVTSGWTSSARRSPPNHRRGTSAAPRTSRRTPSARRSSRSRAVSRARWPPPPAAARGVVVVVPSGAGAEAVGGGVGDWRLVIGEQRTGNGERRTDEPQDCHPDRSDGNAVAQWSNCLPSIVIFVSSLGPTRYCERPWH